MLLVFKCLKHAINVIVLGTIHRVSWICWTTKKEKGEKIVKNEKVKKAILLKWLSFTYVLRDEQKIFKSFSNFRQCQQHNNF